MGGPPPAVFQNNAWNRTLPNLVVFDDVFVDQNVSSGLAIEAGHRQNLHELILGVQAVALNRRLQEFVARIERHNAELRQRGAAVPAAERGTLSIDEFCALGLPEDIDTLIEVSSRNLAAAREREPVRTTPLFDTLNLPAFDLPPISQLLGEGLPTLDAAAAAQVQAHFARIGPGGEEWVGDGMRRIEQDEIGSCPFCAQDLAGSPIINHYRSYFSEAYSDLKLRISNALRTVSRLHGNDVPAAFERAVRVLGERRQFWARFCDVPEVAIDTAAIARNWRSAREAVSAVLTAKEAAPLEVLTLSEGALAAISAYETNRQAIAALNQALQLANQTINLTKEQALIGDVAALNVDLSRLVAVKARHDPNIAPLCAAYLEERAAKTQTEQQRDQVRAELDLHKATVFGAYQTAVNVYLQRFNAGFRLDSVTSTNTRGGPACTYNVIINNTAIPIGGAPNPGEPSFRNTLSSGDRNTLALAFFFASLDQDPALANAIAVIDDPISSLDDHRSLTTVQQIRRLGQQVSQVVILSHNKPFLCRLWEGTDSTLRAALQVERDGIGSTLRAWDVDQDCVTENDRRHALLLTYVEHGGPGTREIATAIRPLLEAYLRVSCPQYFPPSTLLGPFRNACEQRVGTAQEILSRQAINELRDLTEYANRFHHDTNPAWETEAINDGELYGFVRRALNFTKP
jgi:wobble nucleotide-excising tRNase